MGASSTSIFLVLLVLNSVSASDVPDAKSANKQSRIFGGQPCGEDEKYGIVRLPVDDDSNCAATMINNLWGLTAAHCLYNQNNSRLPVKLITDETISMKTVYIHPLYDDVELFNDIAMFYLSRPIPKGKINYVQLPSKDEKVCSSPLVKGWGKTESGKLSQTLLCVNVQYYEQSKCQKKLEYPEDYAKPLICTITVEGKDACGGDSGGPLTCGKVQVGIVSFQTGNCGETNAVTVFTRVSYFLDFIDKTMSKQRKSGVAGNGSHLKIVLASLLVLLIFKYL